VQILHIRNYTYSKTLLSDPIMMKGWPDVFQTREKEEVEKELKEQGVDYSWGKNNRLHIYNKVEAVEKHPVTGDMIWFNHLMVSKLCGSWVL